MSWAKLWRNLPSLTDRSTDIDIHGAAGCPKTKIQDYPYKGKKYPVKEVGIQWLSQAGLKDSPEYGLRLFTIGPEGEIPIHNHLHYQTMYILTGQCSGAMML